MAAYSVKRSIPRYSAVVLFCSLGLYVCFVRFVWLTLFRFLVYHREINFFTRESVSRYKQSLRLCMRNKILRSANAKYHYSYLFFYKMNNS